MPKITHNKRDNYEKRNQNGLLQVMKEYKQAGYNFRYVMKSSTTGEVLIDKTFTKKEYN